MSYSKPLFIGGAVAGFLILQQQRNERIAKEAADAERIVAELRERELIATEVRENEEAAEVKRIAAELKELEEIKYRLRSNVAEICITYTNAYDIDTLRGVISENTIILDNNPILLDYYKEITNMEIFKTIRGDARIINNFNNDERCFI